MLSRNPKSEIRNPKQITSNKFQFSKLLSSIVLGFVTTPCNLQVTEYRVGNANLLLGETK
jgi:hypothetical protein